MIFINKKIANDIIHDRRARARARRRVKTPRCAMIESFELTFGSSARWITDTPVYPTIYLVFVDRIIKQ